MPTRVQILICRGRVKDLKKTRHAALFFMFADGSTSALNVEGSLGDFKFKAHENCIPEASKELERRLDVGEVRDIFSKESITEVVSNTPVKSDLEWNCQSWVGDALERMVQSQFLTASERMRGIVDMAEILLQGEDEPEWY